MAVIDGREVVDVRQAAARLGVSPQEVRRLIRNHDIGARRLAGRWVVPVAELRRQIALDRRVGRPYSPRAAWALLQMIAGWDVASLSAVRRSQLRRALRDADPDELAVRLRRRAARQLWYAHPSVLADLLDDDRVREGAWSRIEELGIDLVVDGEVVPEIYVDETDLGDLVGAYGLARADEIANVVIRVVSAGLLPDALPPIAAALDLLESGEPRAMDGALRRWRASVRSAAA